MEAKNKDELMRELRKKYKELEAEECKKISVFLKEKLKDEIKHKIISRVEDLTSDINTSVGFYMIFSSDYIPENECNFNLEIDGKKYYCIYRGHSYHMSNRLTSHLFYNVNGQYPNCMKIMIDSKRYNINILDKKLYSDNIEVTEKAFPTSVWLVATLALSDTKQGMRELFEVAFDQTFGRPIYSDK